MTDKEFLIWLHARLFGRYGEDLGTDFMLRLEAIAESMPPRKTTIISAKTKATPPGIES